MQESSRHAPCKWVLGATPDRPSPPMLLPPSLAACRRRCATGLSASRPWASPAASSRVRLPARRLHCRPTARLLCLQRLLDALPNQPPAPSPIPPPPSRRPFCPQATRTRRTWRGWMPPTSSAPRPKSLTPARAAACASSATSACCSSVGAGRFVHPVLLLLLPHLLKRGKLCRTQRCPPRLARRRRGAPAVGEPRQQPGVRRLAHQDGQPVSCELQERGGLCSVALQTAACPAPAPTLTPSLTLSH